MIIPAPAAHEMKKRAKKGARTMYQPDQQAHEPKGPTTGPLRPVIVVMDTIDDEEDPRLDAGMPPPQGDDEEQDRLSPVPEEERDAPPPAQQSEEPSAPDDDEPTTSTSPSPREPRPLSLPAATAHAQRPSSLLLAGSLGISLILLAVTIGILLSVNPESLGPIITLLPGITPTASVTLTPAQARLHTSVSLTAVTGTPDPTRGQVRARLLSEQSPSLTRTVPATGHGHTRAQQAGGSLTFYNAAPYTQTVAAGTVLTGADGVQLVTDQAAFLPAANLPAVGMATVPAQAVQVGSQGNIAPLSLNGLCCVAGVSVKNTGTFTGGQLARDYPVVARQDVEVVVTQESSILTGRAQARLQADVRPGEQLIAPAQCHPGVSTDHPVGSEAAHITLALTITCQGEVYDQQAVQQLASAALSAQARTTLGTGYSMQGSITTVITQVATTEAAHGTLSLLVSAQGTWSYQFSSVQISQLTRKIAGLSRQEAVSLLKHDAHIQAVSITQTWNASRLPTDPAHIQVMVLGNVGG
jgi:hypothetical protein